VDEIVEFREGEGRASHLALSIDVTFSSMAIEKKLARIRREIDSESLTKVKYFKSEEMNFMGELGNVPRVVVGMDREAVLDLIALWLRDDKKALASHPVRRQMLEEIDMELSTFLRYAEARGKQNAAAIMRRTLKVVRDIGAGQDLYHLPKDSVFTNIETTLLSTFKEPHQN
jgi:hypothetical protein